jgi:hypothetical protein
MDTHFWALGLNKSHFLTLDSGVTDPSVGALSAPSRNQVDCLEKRGLALKKGENRQRVTLYGLLLALNPVMTVKAGVMFARIARLGWSFGASRACDGEKGIDGADILEGSSCSKFDASV